jgi:hypothetical protein
MPVEHYTHMRNPCPRPPIIPFPVGPHSLPKFPLHENPTDLPLPPLPPTEKMFEKKEGETRKRYTYCRYCAISGSCFPGGISRREGRKTPPYVISLPCFLSNGFSVGVRALSPRQKIRSRKKEKPRNHHFPYDAIERSCFSSYAS